MANSQDNLMPIQEVNSRRTPEQHSADSRKAGIVSGEARRRKASFKQAIKWLMESDIRITQGDIYETYKKQGIDISQFTPAQLATIGLWAGAVTGKNENFRTLMEGNNETEQLNETPDVSINIIDNTTLEKTMYEEEEE